MGFQFPRIGFLLGTLFSLDLKDNENVLEKIRI